MRRMSLGKTNANAPFHARNPGLDHGTEIMTMAGTRPVQTLTCGDRIITHRGAMPLTALTRTMDDRYVLEFDEPQIVLLGEGYVNSATSLPVCAKK